MIFSPQNNAKQDSAHILNWQAQDDVVMKIIMGFQYHNSWESKPQHLKIIFIHIRMK